MIKYLKSKIVCSLSFLFAVFLQFFNFLSPSQIVSGKLASKCFEFINSNDSNLNTNLWLFDSERENNLNEDCKDQVQKVANIVKLVMLLI